MRRASDTGGEMTHLDPDVLAEFRAGLITGRRGTRIGAHLAACDRCAALGDELAGVSALLATVPLPAMPGHVAQRLDTAFAAEVAKRNHSERTGSDSPRKSPAHHRATRSHGFRWVALRVLAPAAGVVLLATGGYELSQLGAGPQTQASTAAGQASLPTHQAASSAGSAVAGPVSSGPQDRALRMPPAAFGVVIEPATLKQEVEAALRVPAAARKTQPSSAAVQACVQAMTGSVKPVLVESVRYQNQPATLIVVRTSQGDTAWVAGSGCSAANHHLLARTTVP